MLNGVAPVLIFNFPLVPKSPAFNALSGIPYLSDSFLTSVGIPIPIYLDENLTGIYVDSQNRAIDIQTTVDSKTESGTPDVTQRGLDNLVTVNMKASSNSVMLSAMLALCDMAFQKVASREYNVSYLNGSTTVFGGLLHGFSTSVDSDNDLVMITLQLSKSNQKINNVQTPTVLPKVTGAIPIR